jgi:hypothetical protein
LSDAQHHCQDADTGHHLNERIHAKAEEGKRLIADTKEDGNQPFREVVKDGE